MMNNTLTRRGLAIAATAALGFGLVACAEEDTADTGTEVTTTAETAAEDTDAEEAAEPSVPDSEPAEGEVEMETEDGTVAVPEGAASALEQFTADWGMPESIETNDLGQVLATFQDGNLATWAQDLGAIPIVGKIAETWMDEGGLESGLGLPTGPEQDAPEGNGWVQQFTDGVISWISDENGDFDADIQQN
ncbi:LGFP repeat-containing protein [Corynebacterium sp.]|uniref:LGFP repeat-containing protein n=1 Tax=Corynebacterium sp. TaxID=1720 RepID=UPI0026DF18A1|nr:hypothetical protein [Corynebacterium sp.]MDO5512413.1 hypothetical protein [Corynebacterium sp.]